MSLQHSPAVVTNGLVFYMDSNNTTKSWKGQPTTNLVSNPNDVSGIYFSGATATYDVINVFLPKDVADASPAGSKPDLVAGGTGGVVARTNISGVVSGNRYMCSWYVKAAGTTTSVNVGWGGSHTGTTPNAFSVNLLTGTTSTVVTNGEYYSVQYAGDGWWRIGASTTLTNIACYPQLSWSGASGVYLCGSQCELGNVMSPFVWGTRSNTQSHIDLMNQTQITSNSLTYNTDRTFSFNGTSGYLSTGTMPWQFLTTGVTISVALKYNQTTNNDNVISWGNGAFNNGLTYSWELRIRGSGAVEFAPGVYTSGIAPARMTYQPSVPLNGRDVVIDIVYVPNGNSYIYEDGNPVSTYNYTGVGVYTNTQSLRIGAGTDSYFPGNIYSVKLYNRPLSPSEIMYNFKGLRAYALGRNSSVPAVSATAIKNAPEYTGSPANGIYWLRPDGAPAPFAAYVDFTTPNGPWVHVGTALGGTTAGGGELWVYPVTWITRTSNYGTVYNNPSLAQNCLNADAFIYCKGNRVMIKEGGGASGGSVGYTQATGLNNESWRDIYKNINTAAWPTTPSYARILPIDTSYRTVSSTSLIYGTNWDTLATQNQFIAYSFDDANDTMSMLATGIYNTTFAANGESDIGIGANENGPAAGGTPLAPILSSTVSYDAGSNGTTATNWSGVAFSMWINN